MAMNYSLNYDVTIEPEATSSSLDTASLDGYSDAYKAVAVISKILIVCGAYLLATLSLYEFRVDLKNRQEGKRRSLTSLWIDKTANSTRWLCLAAAVLILMHFVSELLEIHGGQTSDVLCDRIRHVKAIFQCGAIACLYLVLWLRQRQFYRMPAFKHLCGKTMRIFSFAVVVIMAMAFIITITLYLATRVYASSFRGCIIKYSTIWVKLPGVFLFVFTTTFQVMLVGLLIYPLYKHGLHSSLPGCGKQMQQIKRVSVAAIVAVGTTMLINILSLTVLEQTYGALGQIAHGFDILVTFLSILFSFNDWRARLFAFFVTDKSIIGTLKAKQSEPMSDPSHVDCGCKEEKTEISPENRNKFYARLASCTFCC